MLSVDESLKQNIENIPDLEAAFEAVKGVLFGPLDAATAKIKFNEIVKLAKDKRELEHGPQGILTIHREDRETRDRKDRDHQRHSVMALLSSAQLRERLQDTYDGLDGTRGKGREILDRIKQLEEKLRLWEDRLLANAARHPVTGKAIFQYEDGRVVDEDGNNVPAEDVKDVDFTGKTPAEEKAAYDAARTEVDGFKEEVDNGLGDIEALENELNRRIADDPDKAQEIMDEINAKRDGVDQRFDDIGERVKELEAHVPKDKVVVAVPITEAVVAKPMLP